MPVLENNDNNSYINNVSINSPLSARYIKILGYFINFRTIDNDAPVYKEEYSKLY